MPPKRREVNEPFFDTHLSTFPNCQVTSKGKSNLKMKMKNCETEQ